ncbi:glycoside hydrolase [Streptomyces lunaelactis]|uniref:Glycoside hydrolase n=1 Tax=Streptomyces lunaelactis TaxID=1535768 RepID=A0A2R4SVQ3_9ACTN|nr:lytic transglycosylase domain-containing protein [Streptomyces lunaelactis]AVZ70922.1 glycoside hydrolase [Streptomyces lunaelactis]NUK25178.1 C40 family peptidase [Streptomyces lunaelactis]NUK85611.1 C40 family peptidase [Streptomyces lunaelactis]
MKRAGCLIVLLAVLAVPLMVLFAAERTPTLPDMTAVADVSDIPARMLSAYQNAADLTPREAPKCRGMAWPVLAGIARIESNHAGGRTVAANGDISPHILGPVLNGSGAGGNTTAFTDTDNGALDGDARYERAVGPFQFIPATWRSSGRDGNGDGSSNPHNADDAALGAAVYLCGDGRNLADRKQLEGAVFAYNHSDAYVNDVLAHIDRYAALGSGSISLDGSASGDARLVIAAALAEEGTAYSWGGGGAKGPTVGICCSPGGKSGASTVGYDCSGLTTYAFAKIGISLPRTAAAQAGVGERIPASQGVAALQPGDLVFFGYTPGRDSTIYHVGIYLGSGQMVNSPRPGTSVRTEPVWQDGFAGGARLT